MRVINIVLRHTEYMQHLPGSFAKQRRCSCACHHPFPSNLSSNNDLLTLSNSVDCSFAYRRTNSCQGSYNIAESSFHATHSFHQRHRGHFYQTGCWHIWLKALVYCFMDLIEHHRLHDCTTFFNMCVRELTDNVCCIDLINVTELP